MVQVLLVSKPLVPPWNDSSKNLARDLARSMTDHTPVVLTTREADIQLGRARLERPYSAARKGLQTSMLDHARVVRCLAFGSRRDLWHFFFAPNPRTSRVARLLRSVRRVSTVHTVCSAPRRDLDWKRLLFADITVTVSRATQERFIEVGVPAERLRRVAPCVPDLLPLSALDRDRVCRWFGLDPERPLVVYPGDLEFGNGARRIIEALGHLPAGLGVQLAMACRAKTDRARHEQQALRLFGEKMKLAPAIAWLGDTPAILRLLGAADVVALPAEDYYAKMDLPLALLEAMSLARPVLVLQGTPAAELTSHGGAVATEHSAGAVAAMIQTLVEDPEYAEKLGRRAREVALRDYAPKAMADRYEQLYDSLL